MNDRNLSSKRKADLYTSILLLALSIAMIAETLTFPMTNSYGGVDSVWYVSPALFPLLIASALVIMAIVLLRRAIVDGGARRAWADRHLLMQGWRNERVQRLVIIVACIAGYVYGLVSYVDFFIASTLFLGAFTVPFYLDRSALFTPTLICLLGTSLFVFVVRRDELVPGSTLDSVMLIVYCVMAIWTWVLVRGDCDLVRKWRISMLVSLATPLILVPGFKFGLLVPLPVEGLAINTMSDLARSLSTFF
jgi:hypothetical protein